MALAVLIGASALAVTLHGRPGDVMTAAITTEVVMVSSAVSPQHAWQQPVLRATQPPVLTEPPRLAVSCSMLALLPRTVEGKPLAG
jgi:hypothetical protein